MKVLALVVLLALVCGQTIAFEAQNVTEDCLWGRTDAQTCCKGIEDDKSPHLANPKDCSSFYLCKNEQPLLWPCLPKQIWSVAEQKCINSDTPNKCDQLGFKLIYIEVTEDCLWGKTDAKTCCKGVEDDKSPHLANPKECSSFYLCKNEQPLLWPCLPGQIWSVPDQQCTDSDTPKQCDQLASRLSDTEVTEDCLWGRTDAETCCKGVENDKSPHLANPKDCSNFYLCKNEKPLLWPCLPGQIWSVSDQKCIKSDTPNKCDQLASRLRKFEVSEDCKWGRQDAESCCKEIPEGNSAHLANPKECSSFYLCKNKKPLVWPCLPKQIWNVSEQKCVKSETTNKCDQLVVFLKKKFEVSEDCKWGKQDAESCCKEIPEGNSAHLANPKECSSFYLCKNNKPLVWPCLPGQVWSVPEQKCVKSEITNKCDQLVAKARKFEASEECKWGRKSADECCKEIPEGNSAHLANPKECSSFYLCKNRKPYVWPCLPGQTWSVPEQKCMTVSNPNTCEQLVVYLKKKFEVSEDCKWGRQDAETCCKEIPEGNSAHLANPKECSSFYLCKNHTPLVWPCLPKQIWSVPEQKCVNSADTDKCEQLVSTTKKVEVSENCLWGKTDAASCCKTVPDNEPIHLANPKDCTNFYLCKHNKPLLWPCLSGSIWDVKVQKCIKSSATDKCEQLQ